MTERSRLVASEQNPAHSAPFARVSVATGHFSTDSSVSRLPGPTGPASHLAVIQSDAPGGDARCHSVLAGNRRGAAVGGWASARWSGNAFVFGACAFMLRQSSFSPLRVERGAYRTATHHAAIIISPRPHGAVTISAPALPRSFHRNRGRVDYSLIHGPNGLRSC